MAPDAAKQYPRNFKAMTFYQSLMQIGWVFKTESVVVSRFVTTLTSHPLLISAVPILSRLPQALAQFGFLGAADRAPRKKPLLLASTAVFTGAWGAVAAALFFGAALSDAALLLLFFLLYGLSWTGFGVERAVNRLMTSKLIPVRRRGRVFAIGNSVGRFSSLATAGLIAYLMGGGGSFRLRFSALFGCASLFFLLALAAQCLFREPPGAAPAERLHLRSIVRGGARILRRHRDFRLLFGAAVIHGMSIHLFAFYAAYAKAWSPDPAFQNALGRTLGHSLAAQHVVVGILSLALGWLVDWKGNRVVLRGLCAAMASIPLAAALIGRFLPSNDLRLLALPTLYGMIGCMPVMTRVMANYVLEIAPPERLTLYVGVFGAAPAATLPFPALFGLAAAALRPVWGETAAYELLFAACGALFLLSVRFSWKMSEPRNPLAQTGADGVSSESPGRLNEDGR